MKKVWKGISLVLFILILALSSIAWSGGGSGSVDVPTPTGSLSVGDIIEVYNTGSLGLNVRSTPAGSDTGKNKFDGTTGQVLEGPTYAVLGGTGYNWYKIKWADDDFVGWSVQDYMRKVTISVSVGSFSVTVPSSWTRISSWTGTTTVRITNTGTGRLYVTTFTPSLPSGFSGSVTATGISSTSRLPINAGSYGDISLSITVNTACPAGKYTIPFTVSGTP